MDVELERSLTFDLASAGFEVWWLALLGFIAFLSVGLLMLKFRNRLTNAVIKWLPLIRKKQFGIVSYIVVFGGSVFIVVGVLSPALVVYQYLALARAYESGDYKVVHGIIEGFIPADRCERLARGATVGNRQNPQEHPVEQFRVGNNLFEYSDFLITGGFHQSKACGGPINERLNVERWLGKSAQLR